MGKIRLGSCSHNIHYGVSNPPPLRGPDFFHFFHKRLRIFNRFFTHLLYLPIYAIVVVVDYKFFIQLSLILTKLCHIQSNATTQFT